MLLDAQCKGCGATFPRRDKAQRYCTPECRTQASNARRRARFQPSWRKCRWCEAPFAVDRATGHNKQHCSPECAARSQRKSVAAFHANNPEKAAEYALRRRPKTKRDTLSDRVRKKYPDLPRSCEAAECEEDRVLDLAHKPAFSRNGRWQTMDLYERHMFWVLCPTCHALIDRAGYLPEKLGLK